MKIIVVGGGNVGKSITNVLSKEKNKVILIEKNEDIAKELANNTDSLVIKGDGTDMKTLDDAEIKKADARGEELGMSDDELAFYDALADNQSARDVLGDEKLRELAAVLVDRVKQNASIDWSIKESVRARMKVIVKRLLRQYGYPPDKQAIATETVLKQAELFTEEWVVINLSG